MTRHREKFDPSINAYFNALLRETGPWPWQPQQRHFSITHPESGDTLFIPCHFHSLGGRHILGKDLTLDSGDGPRAVSFQEAVEWTLTLPQLREQSSEITRKGFRYRVQQSEQNLRLAFAYRQHYLPAAGDDPHSFIESEQALINGHSIHPCPKDRGNMNQEEAAAFAPEYGGSFPLIWYSVDPTHLSCHQSARASLASAVRSLLDQESLPVRQNVDTALARGHVVVPCHPFQHRHWQAHPALRALQSLGRLRCLGMGSTPWHATSSLRAIWARDHDWMVKFSMSVRITNSIRHLQPQEAVRGPGLTDLLDSAPARHWLARHPAFRILNEPVAAAICDSEGQPLPETTLVFRDNPFRADGANNCELLATLLQDSPATGISRLGSCLQAHHSGKAKAIAWFTAYLNLAVKPLLDAQSNLGLLFGAHQQNLVLRLDHRFRPVGAWFRDCQGTGFSALAHRQFGPDLAASVQASGNELSDSLGVRLFCYYLFINSTFNVITTLAAAGLCPEDYLWQHLRVWLGERLAENPVDSSAIDYLLYSPQLYAKNNFLCSLRAINENTLDDLESIYHSMPNPLVTGRPISPRDRTNHDTFAIAH